MSPVPPNAAPVTVLFDIDLTLIDLRCDRQVLREVIASLVGADSPLVQLDPTGRSDLWIATQLCDSLRMPPRDFLPLYAAAYHTRLRTALQSEPRSALPGSEALLAALAGREDVVLGLATGNLRTNADLKLTHAGLAGFFQPLRGAFGDSYLERSDIVAAAIAACAPGGTGNACLVADTQSDMLAARTAGATPIGVATGRFSEAALLASGAGATFPDLTALDAILETILGRPL